MRDARNRSGFATALAIVMSTSTSHADAPRSDGHVTYEAAGGIGLLRGHELGHPSGTYPAGAIAVGLGYYFGGSTSLSARFTTLQGGATEGERDLQVANEFFLGATLRRWVTPCLSFAGGIGFGLFDAGPGHGQFALDARAIYALRERVVLTLEATPAFQPGSEAQTQRDMWSVYVLVGYERGVR